MSLLISTTEDVEEERHDSLGPFQLSSGNIDSSFLPVASVPFACEDIPNIDTGVPPEAIQQSSNTTLETCELSVDISTLDFIWGQDHAKLEDTSKFQRLGTKTITVQITAQAEAKDGKERPTNSTLSSVEEENKSTDANPSSSSLNTIFDSMSSNSIVPVRFGTFGSTVSSFSNTPANFVSSICQAPDIGLRQIDPKLAPVGQGDHFFNARSTLSRSPTAISCHSFQALGKRPVGYYGAPGECGGFPIDASRFAEIPSPSLHCQHSCGSLRSVALTSPEVTLLSNSEIDVSFESVCLDPNTNTTPPKPQRAPLLISRFAIAPAIFCYHQDSTTGDTEPILDVVSLSDACPLLVGSAALRDRLVRTNASCDDSRVYKLLKDYSIEPRNVSIPDWIMLWHLLLHEASLTLSNQENATSPWNLAEDIFWINSNLELEKVDFSVKDLTRWLKSKQDGRESAAQRHSCEFRKSLEATRSAGERWAKHKRLYSLEQASIVESKLSPCNTGGIWFNLYRILRLRGISEEMLEREDLAQLMILPRDRRRVYLDHIAPSCRAHTVDNASICCSAKPVQQMETTTYVTPSRTSIIPKCSSSVTWPQLSLISHQPHPKKPDTMEEAEEKDQVASLRTIKRPDSTDIDRRDLESAFEIEFQSPLDRLRLELQQYQISQSQQCDILPSQQSDIPPPRRPPSPPPTSLLDHIAPLHEYIGPSWERLEQRDKLMPRKKVVGEEISEKSEDSRRDLVYAMGRKKRTVWGHIGSGMKKYFSRRDSGL